jgi:hypothetical protein
MAQVVQAVIVAAPGPFCNALQVLLQACPRSLHVALAHHLAAGRQLTHTLAPALVVLDAALAADAEAWEWVFQLCHASPAMACICIVHNHHQHQRALAAGSRPLFAGFSAEALFNTIEQLFPAQLSAPSDFQTKGLL